MMEIASFTLRLLGQGDLEARWSNYYWYLQLIENRSFTRIVQSDDNNLVFWNGKSRLILIIEPGFDDSRHWTHTYFRLVQKNIKLVSKLCVDRSFLHKDSEILCNRENRSEESRFRNAVLHRQRLRWWVTLGGHWNLNSAPRRPADLRREYQFSLIRITGSRDFTSFSLQIVLTFSRISRDSF